MLQPQSTGSQDENAADRLLPLDRFQGSLGQRVYHSLKHAILTLAYRPGDIVRKPDICDRLGVSRSPVADAVAKLASDGLVDVVPQAGTFVTRLSMTDIREGAFIREAIEVAAAERVATMITEDQLRELRRNVRMQEALVADGDQQGFMALDGQLHDMMLSFTGFPRLPQVSQTAWLSVHRARQLILPVAGRLQATLDEHRAILAAFEAQDPDAARRAIQHHLRQLLTYLAPLERAHPELFSPSRTVMTLPNRPRYATRLNAFKTKGDTVAQMIAAAGKVGGLDAADLNYPDHFDHHTPAELGRILADNGMALNGLAMRYYTDPGFRLGSFTHPEATTRRAAIDLTKRGIDALAEMGGRLMTLWLGQDGFDYSFQVDYARQWDDTIAAIAEVADHNASVDIAIEYKPNEPRAHVVMPDMTTTLLGLAEVGRANTGVTLDFCHMLFAGEMPARAAMLAGRHSRILGVHLNDGYGKRDDGLIAGSVHPVQTVELFVALDRLGYDGVIYFDTFPDHGGTDPVGEARANIAVTDRLRAIARTLAGNRELADAQARQDAAAATRLVMSTLYGT